MDILKIAINVLEQASLFGLVAMGVFSFSKWSKSMDSSCCISLRRCYSRIYYSILACEAKDNEFNVWYIGNDRALLS